jgi:predicted flavoprotein YhiN
MSNRWFRFGAVSIAAFGISGVLYYQNSRIDQLEKKLTDRMVNIEMAARLQADYHHDSLERYRQDSDAARNWLTSRMKLSELEADYEKARGRTPKIRIPDNWERRTFNGIEYFVIPIGETKGN